MKEQLAQQLELARQEYQRYQAMGLKLDMSRGKPCSQQLDLSQDLLKQSEYQGESGVDSRNYGLLAGMPEARRFFAQLMQAETPEQVLVAGNSSLTMMYYLIDLGWRKGYPESLCPWRKEETIKFLCPVPGYDRHFAITEYFGFEMIPVPLLEDGPDMDLVEELVKQDPAIKGIWCVPVYSNPDGYVYSAQKVARLAAMPTAAPDFKIIWDNAYLVHHLTTEQCAVPSILAECAKAGFADRAFELCSTSKITFPGAGVAAVASSQSNIEYLLKHMAPMVISFDKMNQMRHVHYLKNRQGVLSHMEKHKEILLPKFQRVLEIFQQELTPWGDIARWTNPKGGYFISLYVMPGCAKRTVELCAQAGVTLTAAGSAYPYGKDPQDSHIRIAPSYPSLQELDTAAQLLCLCVRIAALEQKLSNA